MNLFVSDCFYPEPLEPLGFIGTLIFKLKCNFDLTNINNQFIYQIEIKIYVFHILHLMFINQLVIFMGFLCLLDSYLPAYINNMLYILLNMDYAKVSF